MDRKLTISSLSITVSATNSSNLEIYQRHPTICRYFLLFVFLVPTGQAQDSEIGIYEQTLIDDGSVIPRLFSEGYSYLVERAGVWGFSYVEKQYVSVVVGVFYDLFTGHDAVIEIGAALGAETYPDERSGSYEIHPRFAAFASADYKNFAALGYYESWNGSEGWLRAEVDWQATDIIAFGVFHQTDDGTGPRVRFTVPDTSLHVWVAPMFGEERKLLLGAELIFQK